MEPTSIAIIGSTSKTTLCAKQILDDQRLKISWIMTPQPREIGRKKEVIANPLDQFGQKNNIPTIHIDKRIDQKTQEQITKLDRPEFMLVVDFGYIIPDWLLEWPTIAPLNIHPSKLPAYRGSSPGQFAILFDENISAVTLMKINDKLDQGDIIKQINFEVEPNWTQTEYYQKSFELICQTLTNDILSLKNNPNKTTKQPIKSPTIIAKKIDKKEAFVEWNIIDKTIKNLDVEQKSSSELLNTVFSFHKSWIITINQACKAFSPWPNLWTIIPTSKGDKRMKILETKIENGQLKLVKVQIEGQQPALFNQVKNIIS